MKARSDGINEIKKFEKDNLEKINAWEEEMELRMKESKAGPKPTIVVGSIRPASAASIRRPTSAARTSTGSRPTSAVDGSRPISASNRPTSAEPSSRPTSAADGSTPGSAQRRIRGSFSAGERAAIVPGKNSSKPGRCRNSIAV